MRITVVLQDLSDTGANRVSVDRAARWQASGDDVTVFVTGHEDADGRLPLAPGLKLIRGSRSRRQLRSSLPLALIGLLRTTRRSDVVVAGTEVGFGLLLGWLATRIVRRPFCVTVQSRADVAIEQYVDAILRRPTRAVLVRVDRAVCVAQGLVAPLVALGLPAERVVAVPNAVPRVEIRAAAAGAPDVDWDPSLPTLVASGRLVHQKGFDLLIRAHAAALTAGAPAHRVLVLGEGGDRDELTQLAAELGVDGSVQLAGFTENPHAVVGRAAAFVLPSRWEGLPLSLAEALACGTPCIAFDCVAGPAEVLAGGRYGELVPAEDVNGLARALREHLEEPVRLIDKAELAQHADLDLFDPARASAAHRSALADVRRRPAIS